MPKYIVLLDTPGIKKYIFESSSLKDIRGASAILDGLNRGWLLSSGNEWQKIPLEETYEKQEFTYASFLEDSEVQLHKFPGFRAL